MCQSGAICLPVNCCYSELNKYYIDPTKRVGLVQSGHHHHFIEFNLFLP
jgi:hypothetical protein